MTSIDELRAALDEKMRRGLLEGLMLAREDWDEVLDAWAEKHPFWGRGIAGPECPAWKTGLEKTPRQYCLARPSELCPTGSPCPVLRRRGER